MIVAEDASNRCIAVGKSGQCRHAAVEGASCCERHGGNIAKMHQAKQAQRKYRLAQWEDRKNDFADDSEIKNLNEEVGILRMTLEQMLLACQSETDFLIYSPKLADLVSRTEKLVLTIHKLESSAGILLSKPALFSLADKIISIVSKHVADPDAIAEIANEIGEEIAGLRNEEIDA